jgi:type VI protein secretion system component VasF
MKYHTKTQRELRAHERRARLIAELHRQAIATANDLSAQEQMIEAGITKRQETVVWMSFAGAFIVALASILALLAMM